MGINIFRMTEGEEARNEENKITEYGIKYLVTGAGSQKIALDAVYGQAPRILENGMRYAGARLNSSDSEGYQISAQYSYIRNGSFLTGDNNEPQFSFDCSGGTTRMLRSLEQRKYPDNAPDCGGYIGWNGKNGADCEYAGVDIVTATMRETYTKIIPAQDLNTPFKRKLARLTGKVNNFKFRGWEPGEVLFLGASFSGLDKSGERIAVSYNFAIQENEVDQEAAPGILITKKGWEYVWSVSKQIEKNGRMVIEVHGVYVDAVYREWDLRELGL